MALNDHLNRVSKMRAHIVTVDPSQKLIEALTADGSVKRLVVADVPNSFMWPREGEDWSIYEENGYWYLGNKYLDQEEDRLLRAMLPGTGRISNPKINAGGASSYETGRIWTTRFESEDYDTNIFDTNNVTWQNDPANPTISTIRIDDPESVAHVRVPAKDLRHVDVRLKYRIATISPYGLATNDTLRVHARYLSDDNHLFAWKRFAAPVNIVGNLRDGVEEYLSTGYVGDSDITDSTRYRYLRFQVFENVLRHKAWFEGSPEPDWFETVRLYDDPGGFGDLLPNGSAGFSIYRAGAYFSELRIMELKPSSSNLIMNTDASDKSSNSPAYPLFWRPNNPTPADGNSITTQEVTDQYGQGRTAFFVQMTNPEPDNGLLWRHDIYNPYQTGKSVWTPNRNRPTPLVALPRGGVEVSVWTKAENISLNGGDPATRYGGMFVMYYWDEQITQLNQFPDYFGLFGPNTDVYGVDGGAGTWDWTETRFRIPIHHHDRWVYCQMSIGIHNKECTGKLWWLDPVVRPCS